jgi:hypothetical protein
MQDYLTCKPQLSACSAETELAPVGQARNGRRGSQQATPRITDGLEMSHTANILTGLALPAPVYVDPAALLSAAVSLGGAS